MGWGLGPYTAPMDIRTFLRRLALGAEEAQRVHALQAQDWRLATELALDGADERVVEVDHAAVEAERKAALERYLAAVS